MAIPVENFTPMTWDQANPFAKGIQQSQDIFAKGMQNAYLPQTLAAQLLKSQLENQLNQARSKYYPEQAQAELQQLQVQPQLTAAQAEQAAQTARQMAFKTNNPAFLDLAAALVTGQSGSGNQSQPAGYSQQQPSNQNYSASQGGERAPSQIPSGNTQQDQQGYQGSQGYNYGLQFPNNAEYSNNSVANNLMQKQFGVGQKTQADIDLYNKQRQQQIENYNAENKQASESANSAFNVQQDLSGFLGAYDKLGFLESGKIGGHNKAWTSAADEADTYMAKLVQDTSKLWQTGHITNADIDLTKLSKLGRGMNPDAVHDMADGIQSYNERAFEYQKFMNAASQQQVPFNTAQTLWNKYNQERPAYNGKDKVSNSAYKNTWMDYLTPDAVNNPYAYVPKNQAELSARNPTDAAIKQTARKHNMSVSDVKRILRSQGHNNG